MPKKAKKEKKWPEFRVQWTVRLHAPDEARAALIALKFMRSTDNRNLTFNVIPAEGGTCLSMCGRNIDLADYALCDNCGNLFKIDPDEDLATIPGLVDRIEPGKMVPVCECPECKALAYPAKVYK